MVGRLLYALGNRLLRERGEGKLYNESVTISHRVLCLENARPATVRVEKGNLVSFPAFICRLLLS